jgi:2-aminoadipate transaminase
MPEFAKQMAYMQSTADVIRYLFDSMTDPDTISLGGGAPARKTLPVELVHDIVDEILTREQRGVQALQ